MSWDALKRAAEAASETPILERFEAGDRARDFSISAGDLLFDYDKHDSFTFIAARIRLFAEHTSFEAHVGYQSEVA